MNIQAPQQAPLMVTVAKAAELLTAAGDKITAPNVSRYLDRHPTIRSEKQGRTRQVDIVALATHRQTSVLVADKQSDRGITPAPITASAPVAAPLDMPAEPLPLDDDAETLSEVNLALRRIELRRKTREEDLAAGRLVQSSEVLTLISTVLTTVNESMARQEASIAQEFGREISTAFRRNRKAAFGDAAGRLIELAKRHLPGALAEQVSETATPSPGAES
jgi:hypothetical protein